MKATTMDKTSVAGVVDGAHDRSGRVHPIRIAVTVTQDAAGEYVWSYEGLAPLPDGVYVGADGGIGIPPSELTYELTYQLKYGAGLAVEFFTINLSSIDSGAHVSFWENIGIHRESNVLTLRFKNCVVSRSFDFRILALYAGQLIESPDPQVTHVGGSGVGGSGTGKGAARKRPGKGSTKARTGSTLKSRRG